MLWYGKGKPKLVISYDMLYQPNFICDLPNPNLILVLDKREWPILIEDENDLLNSEKNNIIYVAVLSGYINLWARFTKYFDIE